MENCPKCNSKVFNNKGVSKKNGNPYENFKCSNRDCDFIEWVDNSPKNSRNSVSKTRETIKDDDQYQDIMRALKTTNNNVMSCYKTIDMIYEILKPKSVRAKTEEMPVFEPTDSIF